jgi:F0F1-type ATP synthase epsilon subunit
MIDVLICTPQEILFEGRAHSAIFPGEFGVFEILPFHKPLLSRLISGIIIVEDQKVAIFRGVCQVRANKVTAIVEK